MGGGTGLANGSVDPRFMFPTEFEDRTRARDGNILLIDAFGTLMGVSQFRAGTAGDPVTTVRHVCENVLKSIHTKVDTYSLPQEVLQAVNARLFVIFMADNARWSSFAKGIEQAKRTATAVKAAEKRRAVYTEALTAAANKQPFFPVSLGGGAGGPLSAEEMEAITAQQRAEAVAALGRPPMEPSDFPEDATLDTPLWSGWLHAVLMDRPNRARFVRILVQFIEDYADLSAFGVLEVYTTHRCLRIDHVVSDGLPGKETIRRVTVNPPDMARLQWEEADRGLLTALELLMRRWNDASVSTTTGAVGAGADPGFEFTDPSVVATTTSKPIVYLLHPDTDAIPDMLCAAAAASWDELDGSFELFQIMAKSSFTLAAAEKEAAAAPSGAPVSVSGFLAAAAGSINPRTTARLAAISAAPTRVAPVTCVNLTGIVRKAGTFFNNVAPGLHPRVQCLMVAAVLCLGGDDYVPSTFGVNTRAWLGMLRGHFKRGGVAPLAVEPVDTSRGIGYRVVATTVPGSATRVWDTLHYAIETCPDAPPLDKGAIDTGVPYMTGASKRYVSTTSWEKWEVALRNLMYRLELGCNTRHDAFGRFVYLPNPFEFDADTSVWHFGFGLRSKGVSHPQESRSVIGCGTPIEPPPTPLPGDPWASSGASTPVALSRSASLADTPLARFSTDIVVSDDDDDERQSPTPTEEEEDTAGLIRMVREHNLAFVAPHVAEVLPALKKQLAAAWVPVRVVGRGVVIDTLHVPASASKPSVSVEGSDTQPPSTASTPKPKPKRAPTTNKRPRSVTPSS
jgi:hypothetical protein